ncbi:MAG: lipase family protein [Planctomycetaceae bacterium]
MSEPFSPVQVHSRVVGAISEMPRLQQSLLFAELASASYYDEAHALPLVQQMGFPHSRFFDRDGAQAYMFWNDRDCVVACRGTEPHEWNDIRADVNALGVLTETFGKVHRGFSEEVDDLWPMLENALVENDRTLWFTGHSLGGAMATICAGRCYLSEIKSMPQALFTYGSPRVGCKRFVNFVKLDHSRWVNNNDIVTRVPPAWMGYRHGGTEWYLNRHGNLSRVNGWSRSYDRLRGFLQGVLQFRVDHFSDHSIDRYVENILAAVRAEEGHTSQNST